MISFLGVILVSLVATFAVSVWSYRRGSGFWFAFFWSFLLSPILGALFAYLRRPTGRVLVLVRGGIEVYDPGAPRPIFCAVMIAVVFMAILLWTNI